MLLLFDMLIMISYNILQCYYQHAIMQAWWSHPRSSCSRVIVILIVCMICITIIIIIIIIITTAITITVTTSSKSRAWWSRPRSSCSHCLTQTFWKMPYGHDNSTPLNSDYA